MVFDFGLVKKQIKQFIDDHADHRLLVPVEAPGCVIERTGGQMSIVFPLQPGGRICHDSPEDAVLLVQAGVIDPGQLAGELEEQLMQILPANVHGVSIVLRAESISGAYFHYTHGLQKHRGQCQRIAHGHRSRLEIAIDGRRDEACEREWTDRLRDAYIATDAHVIEKFEHNGVAHTRMAYTAAQGEFAISLPSSIVFVLPHVSTVENIALYLAECVAVEAGAEARVKAFEGVGKGAFGLPHPGPTDA